jgi:CubicO group peptidase (beta-lactamase class C family)
MIRPARKVVAQGGTASASGQQKRITNAPQAAAEGWEEFYGPPSVREPKIRQVVTARSRAECIARQAVDVRQYLFHHKCYSCAEQILTQSATCFIWFDALDSLLPSSVQTAQHTMRDNTTGLAAFSDIRLDTLTKRIQSDIDAALIPGAVMLISRNGKVAYEKALGRQDPVKDTPMGLDSIFRIYSMTKPIVSVAVMMLVEEGRLLLSDPISRYLPELDGLKVGIETIDGAGRPALELVAAKQSITVQDLLRHTSGFTYGIFGESLVKTAYRELGIGSPKAGSDEFIRNLARAPLAYQPGSTWEYSHSTDVLGVLLERLSGMTLDVFLVERLLEPLGMHETGFSVEPRNQHRIAEPFATDPVTGASVKLRQLRTRPNFLSGGGGMVSTVRDYLRFAQMLLNEGELDGVRIVARKTLRYMASDHLGELPGAKSGSDYLPGPGYGFGLGFAVRTSAGDAVIPGTPGDFTWSGLAGTYFWIDPHEKLLAIFLMQAPEQRTHYRQLFRNLVYSAME